MSASAANVWNEFTYKREWGPGIEAGCCGLCGNSGFIDTRGTARTPAGESVGVRAYCICPNGRKAKTIETAKPKWEPESYGSSLTEIEDPHKVD